MNISFIELLKIAVYIEQQGYTFYKALMKKTNDIKSIELLEFLAGQEKEHEKSFVKILETHTNIRKEEQSFFTDDDTLKYLSALSGETVFKDILDTQNVKKDSLSLKECIDIAKKAELNSYNFYLNLKNNFDDAETQQIIQQMADEEEKHYIMLENIK